MAPPKARTVVAALRAADFLPAIYFIFSRKACNAFAQEVKEPLVTAEERQRIEEAYEELQAEQPEAIPMGFREALLNGAASHHAGFLPGALLGCARWRIGTINDLQVCRSSWSLQRCFC